jgi:hypothetical protein
MVLERQIAHRRRRDVRAWLMRVALGLRPLVDAAFAGMPDTDRAFAIERLREAR